MDRNYKHITRKGKSYGLKATAMGVPTHDVAISIAINLKSSQSEAKGKKQQIQKQIKEWFLDSRLDGEHFICTIDTPSGYMHDRVVPMVFRVEIAVRTRKEIQLGKDSFPEIFTSDIEALLEVLGLY